MDIADIFIEPFNVLDDDAVVQELIMRDRQIDRLAPCKLEENHYKKNSKIGGMVNG